MRKRALRTPSLFSPIYVSELILPDIAVEVNINILYIVFTLIVLLLFMGWGNIQLVKLFSQEI